MKFARRCVMHFQDKRGDTIVEVLICLAIVSTILGGAFATTNSSRVGVRSSQEHAEALELIQGQADNVRLLAQDSSSGVWSAVAGGNLFCIDSTGAVQTFSSGSLPPLENDNFSTYKAGCKNVNSLYNIAVDYDSASSIFTFSARWYSLAGGRDQVTLVYRIYHP